MGLRPRVPSAFPGIWHRAEPWTQPIESVRYQRPLPQSPTLAVPLTLYNTLTRRKDTFEPLDANNVRMYVCGPTVYDFAHIGNARPVIVFDVLYRLLRRTYGADHVRYVRNITDVDDKINAAAKANGESIRELTERTAKAFHEDIAALGCLEPDVEPRATEHIPEMIAMISALIAEHSMCQPGRPRPQGLSQPGKSGVDGFHNTKSAGSRL